jgi:DNA-binding MarR family transcriptional regulator
MMAVIGSLRYSCVYNYLSSGDLASQRHRGESRFVPHASRKPGSVHLAAWQAFLLAHARVTERLAGDLERERRLPLTWYEVLLKLSAGDGGGLRMHELARAVLLSRSGLTRLIDRMAAAGLVARCPAAQDRRGMLVRLTPVGATAFRRAAPAHLRGIERHFAAYMTADEARMITDVFARVAHDPTE